MKVILAEKPSVARDIARVLKVQQKNNGFLSGNDYYVTWAFGHLVELAAPDDYDAALKKWTFASLPIIPDKFKTKISSMKGARKQFSVIKKLLNSSDVEEIINATDAGREGELIFRYIYDKSGSKKTVTRLWISSQTDSAIKKGFSSLKSSDDYDSLFASALSRSEADWLVGINATRAYSVKYSQNSGVLSVGRVQTPVLKLIVDRYIEHKNFKPETYYQIIVSFAHQNGDFPGKWFSGKTDKLNDKDKALKLSDEISRIKQGVVSKVTKKIKNEKPPLLYDLTELQKDANKQYKFSANRTLQTAQSLYEKHKVITYPRTSSRYLSNDMKSKMNQLLTNLTDNAQYSQFAVRLLDKPLSFTSRIFNDSKVTDHHAIIPTDKKANVNAFSQDEKSVYDLIIKRFLGVFMDDCVKELTDIIVYLNDHSFKSKGTVIKVPGWRELTPPKDQPKKSSSDDDFGNDQILPAVNEGDLLENQKTELLDKQTKAPALYNEASILSAMETAGKKIDNEELREAMKDCGLGTPATRAQILERLIKVGYIVREKNRLLPTEKGERFTAIVNNDLASPEMTGDWEKKLADIRQGKYSRSTFMEEIKSYTKNLISIVQSDEGSPIKLANADKPKSKKVYRKKTSNHIQRQAVTKADQVKLGDFGNCPRCGGVIIEGKKGFGCSNWKTKNCQFVAWKMVAQKEVPTDQLIKLIKTGKSDLIKDFVSKKGAKFNAYLIINAGNIKFSFT